MKPPHDGRPIVPKMELYGLRKDGSEFPADIMLSTLEIDDGRFVTAAVRDVTERKRAEEALRSSERRVRGILEAAPDAMVVVDQGASIVNVNAAAEEMFGYERDELIGSSIELLIPARLRDTHVRNRHNFMNAPHERPMSHELELCGLRKDGSEFPAEISLSVLDADEGRFVTAAVRDVTERKQMEERLRWTREDIESNVESQMRRGGAYRLTFREFTVLHHVAVGKSDKEIGMELGISPYTVRKHVSNILSKMEASSRTEAGVRATREGLLDQLVPGPPAGRAAAPPHGDDGRGN